MYNYARGLGAKSSSWVPRAAGGNGVAFELGIAKLGDLFGSLDLIALVRASL